MDTIFQHRSIRKYKTTPIPDDILNNVLTAATRASTTGNMQVYSIVVTMSPEIKEQLWAAHFRQDMVKIAPVVLTFCADFNRFSKWCTQREAEPGYENFLSFTTATIDALLAAQNAALEAEYLGLGICYLGTTTYNAPQIIDILKLPKGVVPITTIVLGYAEEIPPLTDRLPLEAVVHSETYQDYSEDSIDWLYAEKETNSFYLNLVEQNKTKSLAHIFTEKRYTKKDNELFSEKFMEALKTQGFI